jgi:hypothetical protein
MSNSIKGQPLPIFTAIMALYMGSDEQRKEAQEYLEVIDK